jgi:hypothetical protein
MAGYDPKKAETFNKLKQQGLTEDQAWAQAGLTDNDIALYVINDSPYNDDGTKNTNRGQIGPHIVGSGTQTIPYTAAEKAESDAYYNSLDNTKNVERVAYPVKADSQPSNKTPITYTTTSTEQVSGGGSTTTTAGVAKANERSTALQAQADAKTAEIKQFQADNPINPNATPEEKAARRAKISELASERGKLATAAEEAKTPGNPTETTVPNTTTNSSTTTYSQSSTNSDVETTAGPDPALNQEPSLNNTQVEAARAQAAQDPYSNAAAAQESVQNNAPPTQQFSPREAGIAEANDAPTNAPAAVEPGSLAETQNNVLNTIQTNPVSTPGTVPDTPANTGIFANPDYSPGAITGTPAPVNLATDPGAKSPFGGGAFNTAAEQNPEAAAAAYQQEQANQEAAMVQRTKEQQAVQAQFQAPADGDWRVRLRLAPSATYLYMDANNKLLSPLKASNGVVFPYMPTIQTSYNADYSETALTHSNYKGYFYNSSHVGDVQITGMFTAQDTREANYLLAVIHFFRSVTKMFYGQDAQRGAPPPLVYISGLGEYQFNNQPCVVKSFTYSLPSDVDYIRTKPNNYNINLNNRLVKSQNAPANSIASVVNRLKNALLPKGALPEVGAQELTVEQSVTNIVNDTYVPTKIEIQINLLPMQTRSQQSQQFSVREFSNGTLLTKGGFW